MKNVLAYVLGAAALLYAFNSVGSFSEAFYKLLLFVGITLFLLLLLGRKARPPK